MDRQPVGLDSVVPLRYRQDMTDAESLSPAVDYHDAQAACQLLRDASAANLDEKRRHGSIVDLPRTGTLWVTGDLHDARDNLRKMIKLVRWQDPDHHLILHELIHGPRLTNNCDFSYRTLLDAAALKVRFPEQVHFLLANHELAQIQHDEILKGKISVVQAFLDGLDYVFGEDATKVEMAMMKFIRSMPMAVRCANGLFCAHSLPNQRKRAQFDPSIVDRVPTRADLLGPNGSAHLMVWGRNIAQDWADDLAAYWSVECFALGHQPAEMGYETHEQSMLILNSDDEHGMVLEVDLSQPAERDPLIDKLIPLAGVI